MRQFLLPTVGSLLTLAISTGTVRAGAWIDLPIGPSNPNAVPSGNQLIISEKAAPGLKVQIVLSQPGANPNTDTTIDATGANPPKSNGPDSVTGGAVSYNGSTVWGGSGTVGPSGKLSFTFPGGFGSGKNRKPVTDYHQQTGDPGILSAAAFDGGTMVPLDLWLTGNGNYGESNGIIQPDFMLPDGTPLWYGVDLAQLGGSGAALAAANAFGTDFTIGAGDSLPGLTGYEFSTSMPLYSPGSGWQVTAPAPGTVVEYFAFHNTYIPEPASMGLMALGLSGLAIVRRRSRR
jgi:hypothetical protein